MSHHRFIAASALALLALVPAGCLGGEDESASSSPSATTSSSTTASSSATTSSAPTPTSGSVSVVPKDAVAQVGGQKISMGAYQQYLAQIKARYRSEGRAVPKPGTDAWTTLRTSLAQFLVERTQLEQKAKELGITVTDEQVAERLAALKKAQFGGSEAKFQAELAKKHVTLASVEADIRAQLVREQLYAKLTRGIRVTDEEVRDYYNAHRDAYRTSPGKVSSLAAVEQQIHDQLLAAKKNEKMTDWIDAVTRELSRQTDYQAGFLPPGQRGRAGTDSP